MQQSVVRTRPFALDQTYPQSGSWWLTLLCCTLLGYALLGKGWASVGIPPLFIGEFVLLLGLVPWRRSLFTGRGANGVTVSRRVR